MGEMGYWAEWGNGWSMWNGWNKCNEVMGERAEQFFSSSGDNRLYLLLKYRR